MDIQNQKSPQTDYDFILNQAPDAGHKHKSKRKIIVVFAVLAVFMFLVIMSIVAAISSSVDDSKSQLPSSSQDTINSYLSLLNSEDYEGAYNSMSSNTPASKEAFIKSIGPQFLQVFSVEKCSVGETLATVGNTIQTEVTCPRRNDGVDTRWLFTAINENNQQKITGYTPLIEDN